MSHQTQATAALAALQSRAQWVCWRKEQRKGKWTKVPYNPQTGQLAESNNPRTWSPYALALAAWQQQPQRYNGIGYMFNRDVTGIDLDHCIDAQGTIEPWAWSLIEHMSSYAEYSPSGEGVHIWVRGTIPKGLKRAIPSEWNALQGNAALEMYCEGRYFTVTGNHIEGTPTTIEDRQDALNMLYQGFTVQAAGKRTASHDATPLPLDDALVLKKAEAASNGGKFRALFYQGSAGYTSASEADFALCLMLAFWTGRDTTQMDRLFRRSALYREKWDSARSASTYGQDTILKAAAVCDVVYDPRQNQSQLERDIDHLLERIALQQGKMNTGRKGKPYQLKPKEVEGSKVLAYLDENEYGDARFFADAFAGQVCYDHDDKEWYLWQGHYWKRDANGRIRQLVAGVLGTLYLKAAADLNTTQAEIELQIQTLEREKAQDDGARLNSLKGKAKMLAAHIDGLQTRAKGLRTAKRMNNVLTFVQSEMGTNAERWDTDPWLLAVQNGVIDLHIGECREGNPEDYIRTVAPTDWTGLETPCPRFEQFLQEIFEDKPDRETFIAFLQRLLGYGITGLTTQHIFPVFYGEEGRNGKDTLLATLKGTLGPQVGAVSNDVFLAQDKSRSSGAATPHLCDLQGKRLVWGSETKEGDRLNIAQIKHLTGGGEISARKLHGHQYAFAPTHKLLLMTNYKPHADARDKAFWSRACLIEFGIRFVDDPHATNERLPDKNLKETLKEERSGILAWLIRGCLTWQEQGLDIPASVQLATDKYRDEEDKLLLFIQECCIVAEKAYVQAGALFIAYHTWYESNQFGGRSMNGKLFGEEMAKRFGRGAANGRRVYKGIGLLASDNDPRTLFDEQDVGRGSVEGQPQPSTSAQPSSEANLQDSEESVGRGCRGLSHVSQENEVYRGAIGAKTWFNPLHPLPNSSVYSSETASQAAPQEREQEGAPSTDPLPENETHACTTQWEGRKKTAHKADATRLSAGCWWCEQCAPQRELMEVGERINYPKIDLSSHGFIVSPGRKKWLRFAKEAGYELMTHALGKATSLNERETPSERENYTS